MNRNLNLVALLAAALLPLAGVAQSAGNHAPADAEEGRPAHPRPPAERGEGPAGPMTERWLQRLQADQPEEFARLRELKDRDPAAFQLELHRHLRNELGTKLQRERPAIFGALQALPDKDREWVLGRLFGGEEQSPRGPGANTGFNPEGGTRSDDENDLRSLARSYRQAGDEQAREQLRRAIRDKLHESFNRMHERRRRELDQMEVKLKAARGFLQEREINRDAIIDRRLKELTNAPPLPPA